MQPQLVTRNCLPAYRTVGPFGAQLIERFWAGDRFTDEMSDELLHDFTGRDCPADS